jgi:hypothetical protein
MVRVNLPIALNPVTVTGIITAGVPGRALMIFPAVVTGASAASSAVEKNQHKTNPKKTNFFKDMI